MSYFRHLIFVSFVFSSSITGAHAEQGCPDGFTPNAAGTPGMQCIPIGGQVRSGDNSGGASAPQVIWAKRWGAIAYDPVTGKVGVANDMTSRRKATKGALDHCRSKGGTSCAIAIDYGNQCGAITYGGEGEIVKSAAASAARVNEAEALALRNCRNAAGFECKVFYSGCSYPERIQ